jgi:prepilin-type N-terminal cleavage/methylation domain-containing protein/prepilin-type processing-associated H-X9-DG protein
VAEPRAGRELRFTLIELLVVIGIIAVLMGILLPVLSRAREQGKKANCGSNMKQIGTGFMIYIQEAKDTLPPYSFGTGPQGCLGYGGGDGIRWADFVYPYVENRKVYDCPSHTKKTDYFAGGEYLDIRTYSYGYSSPSGQAADYGAAGRALVEIVEPQGTIVLAEDGRPDANVDAESIGRVIPAATDTLEIIGSRVNGMRHTNAKVNDLQAHAFNAVYADGHVKFVRLTETFPAQWSIAKD